MRDGDMVSAEEELKKLKIELEEIQEKINKRAKRRKSILSKLKSMFLNWGCSHDK